MPRSTAGVTPLQHAGGRPVTSIRKSQCFIGIADNVTPLCKMAGWHLACRVGDSSIGHRTVVKRNERRLLRATRASLSHWMGLTPELVRAHLNLDQPTLRKDKAVIVGPQR